MTKIPRQLVDTNILARFFTGDPPAMAIKARRLVERAESGDWLSNVELGALTGLRP